MAAVKRMVYLDRLKVLLTGLVVVHHLAIAYGGAGSWFFVDPHNNELVKIVLTLFTTVNQSFMLGLFFFISGYVTPSSYDRKGAAIFIKDRLIRLGIPLIMFMLLLSPVLRYVAGGFEVSFGQYFKQEVITNPFWGLIEMQTGPLWYVFALLLFSAGYVIYRKTVGRSGSPRTVALTPRLIVTYLLAVVAANFVVRLFIPVGETVFSLQLGYFPAYIGMFMGGIAAYRGKWLEQLRASSAKKWLRAVVLIIILMPVVMALGGALEGNIAVFMGGLSWQSLFYSASDPVLGLGISIILLVWFRDRKNVATSWSTWLSAQAFTVFIIHAIVATYTSYWLRDISMYPLLKYVFVALIVVPACFVISALVRTIPLVRRVL